MEIKEDIGEKVLSMLDEIEIKLKKKVEEKEQNEKHFFHEGKKNSHIHLLLETNLKEKLMGEAKEKCISISELCRQKLRDDTQLDRIEMKINNILGKE